MSSSMPDLDFLRVKLFADGADIDGIRAMYARPEIKGFTTNPTLMRKAGQTNYKAFAQEVLHTVPDRPISFEVLADEFNEMEQQENRRLHNIGQRRYHKEFPTIRVLGPFPRDFYLRCGTDSFGAKGTRAILNDLQLLFR